MKCNQCNQPLPDGYTKRNCERCLERRRNGEGGVSDHRWPLRTEGELRIEVTRKSGNAKLGPILSTRSSSETCPPSCPMFNAGCFGENPRLRMWWKRVPDRGMPFDAFLEVIRELPPDTLWRHNEVGDLPGEGERLDPVGLLRIALANKGRRGFTMTHKHRTTRDRKLLRMANRAGFTVNLSADNVAEADRLRAHNVGPVVVTLPREETRRYFDTGGGSRVVVCPAYRTKVTCATCGLCQRANRQCIVGFPAHSHQHRKVSLRVAQ